LRRLEAGASYAPAGDLGEDLAGPRADAVGEGLDAGAHQLAEGAGVGSRGRLGAASKGELDDKIIGWFILAGGQGA
jgi:hypothetical protein